MGWIEGTPSRGGGQARVQALKLQAATFAHYSHVRCGKCQTVMRAVGTIYDGRIKRWRCDKCDRRAETQGLDIPTV